jgi:myo-inositol-1(or 4)-monophosphatase
VSGIQDPARSLVGTGFPFKHREHVEGYLGQLGRVLRSSAGVRRAGAAALDLADVAAGRLDAFWELMLAPWDIAAGLVLVREAGGRATDLESHEVGIAHTGVIATNGHLHAWLEGAVRGAESSSDVSLRTRGAHQ